MNTPLNTGIALCPICHKPLKSSAQHCPHCGAIKQFGPALLETALFSLVGMVVFPALSTLFIPLSLWSILIAFIGLGAGFIFAQFRFTTERWVKAK
ncbi:zinc ribbon domain-containing protein [Aristophania vespae]|uniref:zinc ribbon domain-containing protein n=1 Tax=Aristophania vespae TaxID=2697033 RepID=UPI001F2F0123|nr:zinc ribbon domain-containing protein [Aristophania vespae]UMM64456.1 hypothetical protein DM15PD_14700 [Aristophania vespae]